MNELRDRKQRRLQLAAVRAIQFNYYRAFNAITRLCVCYNAVVSSYCKIIVMQLCGDWLIVDYGNLVNDLS